MPTQGLQRKKVLQRTSTWLGSVCVVILGLAQLETQIQRAVPWPISDAVFDWIILVAGVGLAIAVVLWLLSFFPPKANEPLYLSSEIRRAEVSSLRRFAVEFFGETFATEQRILNWLEQRKDCVIVVRRIARNGQLLTDEIRGFYMILPLTRNAVELYKRNEITGATFLKEHISRSRKDTYGVYVAAIAATDPQARSSALMLLHRSLEEYRKKSIQVVLARPTTARGRDLADEYGMTPLPGTELEGNVLYEKNVRSA